ncbi:hypothetical protein L5515_007165 [Caenorhabditis briggsae]|uniref:G-protein coupled receptors family 1 profile domain-containing protein n=1 Tax=Caenorhabditis briggsae TaxID=6238 RepID=A0AAE9F3F1_CAEBR|nr:hypothetical protein L5515_007165 [Caenorhabditis briggsae]
MMMSSIIAIMIGIGICDLIAMIATIQSVDFFFDEEGTDWIFRYLATYLNHLCNSIFIINATFHGIVCFMMSSQYRATVWKILRLNKDQPATSNSTQLSRVEKI